jgi:hypothetical protein
MTRENRLPKARGARNHRRMAERRRRGFGILAIIMFVGIIATLLALSFKTIMYANSLSRARETWLILESIRRATFDNLAPTTYPVFRQRVLNNPGRISQLLGPVNSGDAVNYPDACGTTYTTQHRDNSRLWAPFLVRSLDPAVGLATPLGTLDDDFIRINLGPGQNWFLQAVIPQVDTVDLKVLDTFDTGAGATAGVVRWDNIAGGTARLTYMIAIDASC